MIIDKERLGSRVLMQKEFIINYLRMERDNKIDEYRRNNKDYAAIEKKADELNKLLIKHNCREITLNLHNFNRSIDDEYVWNLEKEYEKKKNCVIRKFEVIMECISHSYSQDVYDLNDDIYDLNDKVVKVINGIYKENGIR